MRVKREVKMAYRELCLTGVPKPEERAEAAKIAGFVLTCAPKVRGETERTNASHLSRHLVVA